MRTLTTAIAKLNVIFDDGLTIFPSKYGNG